MKKKICFIAFFAAMCAIMICGCTPKDSTVWCDGLKGDKFQIEYSVLNRHYNGVWASFSVKDEEAFEEYLGSHPEYVAPMQMSDTEEEVYLFSHNGQNYFCRHTENGKYALSACRFNVCLELGGNTENICFAFPPISFDVYHIGEGDGEIEVIRQWDYFSSYYSALGDATVNEEEKTVSLDVYGSESPCGNVILSYLGGTISYQITLS